MQLEEVGSVVEWPCVQLHGGLAVCGHLGLSGAAVNEMMRWRVAAWHGPIESRTLRTDAGASSANSGVTCGGRPVRGAASLYDVCEHCSFLHNADCAEDGLKVTCMPKQQAQTRYIYSPDTKRN